VSILIEGCLYLPHLSFVLVRILVLEWASLVFIAASSSSKKLLFLLLAHKHSLLLLL